MAEAENSEGPSRVSIGQRLAEERRRRWLTQAQLAERVGLGRSMMTMIELGRTRLDSLVLLALESKAGIDPFFVLKGQRAAVAAADMLDWALIERILDALASARERCHLEISPAEKTRAIRLLYRMSSHDGRVSQEGVDDLVRHWTGFSA